MAENPNAFPSVCLNDPCHPESVPGMTLRDWFAGQVIGGLMASSQSGRAFEDAGRRLKCGPDEAMARAAYLMADAMLAARADPQS